MWESSELNSLQELESDGFELKIVSLYSRSPYHRLSSRQRTSIVLNGSQNIIQLCSIRGHTISHPRTNLFLSKTIHIVHRLLFCLSGFSLIILNFPQSLFNFKIQMYKVLDTQSSHTTNGT